MQAETVADTTVPAATSHTGVVSAINRTAKSKDRRLGIFDVIPSSKNLRQLNKPCRNCGSRDTVLRRTSRKVHLGRFSLFKVPGEDVEYVDCNYCGFLDDAGFATHEKMPAIETGTKTHCSLCNAYVESSAFKACPNCGQSWLHNRQ